MPGLRSPLRSPLRSSLYSPLVGKWGGGSIPIVPTTNILVANRTQYNTSTRAVASTATYLREHYFHPDGDVTDLQCLDINRYLSGVAAGTAGAVRTISRSIELSTNPGVYYDFLWSGVSSVSLAASAQLKSDPLAGVVGPAGTKFWEMTYVQTAGTFPCMELPATAAAIGVSDGAITGDFRYNRPGIPQGSSLIVGANAFIGTVNATAARSFVLVGDSLTLGTFDATTSGAKGGSGFPARILDQHGYPYFKFCKGGMQTADHVTVAPTFNTVLNNFSYSDIIFQPGLNDLSLGSRTKAQIEADLQTLFAQTNVVGKRIYKTTITPRSDSTDAWATTANQTPKIDGNMADLTGLNTDIRAGLANVNAVIEAADAAMSARDSNIHKAPPAGTADGVHFDSTRTALIAALLSV